MGQYFKAVVLEPTDKREIVAAFFAHDYDEGLKINEHSYQGNSLMNIVESCFAKEGTYYQHRIVWAGDYAQEEFNKPYNLYCLARDKHKKLSLTTKSVKYKYCINHSKKLFVNNDNIPVFDGFKAHPLPLLTVETNKDADLKYSPTSPGYELLGTWARDIISVSNECPQHYSELGVKFCL